MAKPLSILVYGAGAMGSYLGGSLALQGSRVTFLERPHNDPTLKKEGLRLGLDDGEYHLEDFGVATRLREALDQGSYDVAFFALKSYDTAAALEEMLPHSADMPPVLCLQNGVDNEAVLAEVLGEDKVIAGTVTTAVGKSGPGQIQLERKRGVGLANGHPLSKRLYAAMAAADLNPEIYAKPLEMKWSKLLTNLLTNASCAILDLTPAEIFENKDLFRLEMLQLRETLAVMRALDLGVVDLPGTPVRALAFAARRISFSLARPLMARAVGRGRGGKMPSLHIDLHSGGGRSEIGWLNGAVLRHGDALGVPTPVNRALYETLSGLLSGDLEADQYRKNPVELLAELD
jgi:2-dehydropantoate 2-reductase